MTFKQVVDVLFQRKWLIVAVIVVAMVIAALYLQFQVKSYSSTISARTSVSVTDAALGGELAGVQVDFDPSTITSSKVLDRAAVLAGEPKSKLKNAVTYDINAGQKTNVIAITAVGSTPQAAQRIATSVIKAYTVYVQTQINNTLTTLSARQVAATASAVQYQQQASADPENAIATSNLSNALSNLGTLNNEIESIKEDGAPLTLLDAAPPGTPQGAGTLLVLLLALAAGLIAGIGTALIRDQFDNRLRGEYEIEPLTSLPSLGELSYDRTIARGNEVLPAASGRQSPLGEGLRSLRTSLQVLLPRQGAVVVFTSVEPGDGKTFVSANIAVTWARAGKKIILVGGDLRRPTLANYFGEAADGPGLTEILRDASETDPSVSAAQVEGYLKSTEHRGLRLLPAGFDSADPADLLATSALKEVIGILRTLADVVIIDSPPAMALVDASLLAEHADGVVVLASVNKTDRSFLVETIELLHQNGALTLGVVANRSRRSLPKSYAPYYIRRPERSKSVESPTVAQRVQPVDAVEQGDSSTEAPELAEDGGQETNARGRTTKRGRASSRPLSASEAVSSTQAAPIRTVEKESDQSPDVADEDEADQSASTTAAE